MSITRDERYLRTQQYQTDERLRARMALHERFSTNPESWFQWLRRELAPHLTGSVLDVGCGNARLWTDPGLPAPQSLVLCDLSGGMLREARRALAGASARIRFVQGSAGALPFAAQRFDTVLANHMLYHVPDLPRALEEIRRVLFPGGRLFASSNGPDGMREIDELLREVRPGIESNSHVRAFGLAGGAAALAPCFEGVGLSRYRNALEVTDPEAVVAYVASMEAARGLGVEELDALRARVAERIRRDGSFHVTIDAGTFAATRRS